MVAKSAGLRDAALRYRSGWAGNVPTAAIAHLVLRCERRRQDRRTPKLAEDVYLLCRRGGASLGWLGSTFSEVPSCSISLRWSRVSLVGVRTRT